MIVKIGLYHDPRKKRPWVVRWFGEYDPKTGKEKRYSKSFKLKRDAEAFQAEQSMAFKEGQQRDKPAKRSDRLNAFTDSVRRDFHMVVIGSSTGGPPALQNIFSAIQEEIPVAFAVAQHMPPDFTRAFAERLNRFSALNIREAENGDIVRPGEVLIAPGGKNLEFFPKGTDVIAKVSDPKGHQRYLPSVDTLFTSAATIFAGRLLGVVLTGMGNDGAMGVHAVKQNGGSAFAEAEESCVVFGMPKEAIATGLVDRVVPLPLVCKEIMRHCGYGS